jgi:acetyl-CoA acetyltransferase
MSLQRASVAVVGCAESDLGEVAPGMHVNDLMAQAVYRALDDAGISLSEVDGLYATTTQSRMATISLAEYLGISPRVHDCSHLGGASFEFHVASAQAAIEAGRCSVAVIAYGSTQRTAGRGGLPAGEYIPHEAPFRPLAPISSYALAASRHMHEFGTTREQLAEVAVAARQWAALNPKAFRHDPLTVADVLNARRVSSPFGVLDCCLFTDGGGALVLVSAERARTMARTPAYVLGVGGAITHQHISGMPDLTVTGARESGAVAFAMAGLRPPDIDVVELYDAFTITPILFLEDLGFCAKGEGGRFVSDGAIAPGGRLPVNTNGGGLSYCHPGMYGIFLLIEAVRQLRGECGGRQVGNCRFALAHGNGGVLSAQATVILGNQIP